MTTETPAWIFSAIEAAAAAGQRRRHRRPATTGCSREYDPEWAEAFYTGRVALTCDHENMLRQVKVPVLFTHHFRVTDPETGQPARRHLRSAGRAMPASSSRAPAARSPTARSRRWPHSMHGADPALYSQTIDQWIETL